MKRPVVRTEAAVEDLKEIWVYIGLDRVSAADRFLEAVEVTFGMLSAMPSLGRVWKESVVIRRELRVTPVSGFPSILVFYQVLPDCVRVLRVSHGARDLPSIVR